MKISFYKMHGLGNDFVLLDALKHKGLMALRTPRLAKLSREFCNRRFGIGADQLLLLTPSKKADFRMRIFNADGSAVEMCGNGIRCLAQYIWSKGYSRKKVLAVETLAGIIRPEKKGALVRVDMGKPVLDAEKIPVRLKGYVQDYPLKIKDRTFNISCVSMGNPHAVISVDRLDIFPVAEYGPLIETHPLFPKRTNVEFIQVMNKNSIRMRVWERGSGETLACGTGATAAAVVSMIKGHTGRRTSVHLTAGKLLIEWSRNGNVFMTGPAVKSFEGMVEL